MISPPAILRKGDWKLIESFDPATVELYNLSDDLGETAIRSLEPTPTAEMDYSVKSKHSESPFGPNARCRIQMLARMKNVEQER
jgi:hypothetical protein